MADVQLSPTAQKVLAILQQNRGTPYAANDVCEVADCSTGQANIALEPSPTLVWSNASAVLAAPSPTSPAHRGGTNVGLPMCGPYLRLRPFLSLCYA